MELEIKSSFANSPQCCQLLHPALCQHGAEGAPLPPILHTVAMGVPHTHPRVPGVPAWGLPPGCSTRVSGNLHPQEHREKLRQEKPWFSITPQH